MSHEHDGSSLDLEKALVRYMVERRVSRRQVLEAVAKLGPAVALAPVIAACTSAGVSPSAAASASAAAPGSAAPTTNASGSLEPTPAPVPEGELYVYNWTEYIGDQTVPSFEEKYDVKVTYDFFSNTDEAYAKLGTDGGGYDVSFPISVDVPGFIATNALLTLDKSLIPNIVNLGAEWADPKYDPGNAHSVPYMWWTTGVAYDSKQDHRPLRRAARRSGTRSTTTTSRCSTTGRRPSRSALLQLGLDPNTTNIADLDQALALLETQKPLVAGLLHRHRCDVHVRRHLDRTGLGLRPHPDQRGRPRTCATTSPRKVASGAPTPSRSSRAPSTRSRPICS